MKKLVVLFICLLFLSGCQLFEEIKSVNEDAKYYKHNSCRIYYPDNKRVEEYAKSYCNASENIEILDYSVSDIGDFITVSYPNKSFILNKDFSEIELEIQDKKMLSELFIYEFKKSENDIAYTKEFLIENHYSNIAFSDFSAEYIDEEIIVHSLKYDFDFKVDKGYSKQLFNADFGETKEYVKKYYISDKRPIIALTFDDGPYWKVDQGLFELFDLYDGRCTFFIVGSRLSDSELENIKTGIDLNNEYGSHGFDHENIKKIKLEDGIKALTEPMDVLNEKFDYDMKIYRQPYGYRNKELENVLKEEYNLKSVLWNVDSLDWKTRDKDAVYDEIIKDINGSEIVLMHSLYVSTLEGCQKLVPELIDKGYQLVTCSELIDILDYEGAPVYGQ